MVPDVRSRLAGFGHKGAILLAAAAMAIGMLTAGAGSAAAAPASVCTGDLNNFPNDVGTLSGTYPGNVTVVGACAVDAGAATVNGNLTVTQGSTLLVTFASDDLTVWGNLQVQNGGALILGCSPSEFQCFDDPSGTAVVTVGKNLTANQPLGLIAHNITVHGNLAQNGGGGGVTCNNFSGIFGAIGFFPAFIDVEDSTVWGNFTLQNIQTCYLAAIRDWVGGNASDHNNVMDDPDANEFVGNTVQGNLDCRNNSPMVQFGDSGAAPNGVHRNATGECGFNVYSPDPNYDGGGSQPISVKI